MKKLLGVYAHPDDEVISGGGTVAKYVKAGWQADMIIATHGEAGSWGDVQHHPGKTLEEVRTKELEESAGNLGIRSVTFLEYKDGALAERKPGDIEAALARTFREMRPDVVFTHEPAGITNNPDHVRLSLAATYAFQLYAKDRHDELPDDANPPKLYFSCFPATVISYLVKRKQFPGELFGKPVTGTEDKKITTVIDIGKFSHVKMKAMEAHRTQKPILEKYMDQQNNPFLAREYFVLRYIGTHEVFMGKNDRVSDRL